MTIRPRAARIVRDIRTRLRDVAAASHTNLVAVRDESLDALAREEAQLEQHLATARHALASARTIHDLDRVAETTGIHRLAITEASDHVATTTAATRDSEVELRHRARQLRSSERLVERLDHEGVRRDQRDEQRANDDLSARRR